MIVQLFQTFVKSLLDEQNVRIGCDATARGFCFLHSYIYRVCAFSGNYLCFPFSRVASNDFGHHPTSFHTLTSRNNQEGWFLVTSTVGSSNVLRGVHNAVNCKFLCCFVIFLNDRHQTLQMAGKPYLRRITCECDVPVCRGNA